MAENTTPVRIVPVPSTLGGPRQDRAHDPVNSPSHYAKTDNGIECIDALRAALGQEGFMAFCRGNAIKYLWRAGKKDDMLQDARKAEWYVKRLIKELEAKADAPPRP